MKREEATKTLPVSMLETISDATDKMLIFPTEECEMLSIRIFGLKLNVVRSCLFGM